MNPTDYASGAMQMWQLKEIGSHVGLTGEDPKDNQKLYWILKGLEL